MKPRSLFFLTVAFTLGISASMAVAQDPRRVLSDEAKQQVEAACPLKRRRLRHPAASCSSTMATSDTADTARSRMRTTRSRGWARKRVRSRPRSPTIRRVPEGTSPQFDAVCLNNTVGNLFTDPVLRQNLLEFVLAGGGLAGHPRNHRGVHRFSERRTETWPEFGHMIGGRGAAHLTQDEHVFIKLDEPDHPLNRPFGGQGFEHVGEFFRVSDPYSRDRVRVLMSIDTAKTDLPEAEQAGSRGGR